MKKIYFLVLSVFLLIGCEVPNTPSENDSSAERSGSISCEPSYKEIDWEIGKEFSVSLFSTTAWSASSDQTWVSISPNSGQGDALVTITIPAGSVGIAKVLFSNGEGSTTLTISSQIPSGVLNGKFSVSKNTQVQFSKGNLLCINSYRGEYRFTENQYDYDDHYYHRDLFEANEAALWAPSHSSPPIRNGGNTRKTWWLLSVYEWEYLFSKRKDATILRGAGKINETYGLIILPDKWEQPTGLSFTPEPKDAPYNTYSEEEWARMEDAGAVFLPSPITYWAHANGTTNLRIRGNYKEYSRTWTFTSERDDYGTNRARLVQYLVQ